MSNWFSIEKIDKITYALSEYKHSEIPHSYLLIGNEKALLIDSGLGVSHIREEVEKLTDLEVIVLSTHIHWDHVGGHKLFDKYYVHENEKNWMTEKPFFTLECIKQNLVRGANEFPKDFVLDDYEIFKKEPERILKDEDIIDLGDRKIKVIHTPGHSPGHICLYDIKNKYIFTGDLVYRGTLYAFFPTSNPVDFKNSLEKIKDLDVKRVFPGHNSLDLSPSIIPRAYEAFKDIEEKGMLKHGSGLFDYDEFRILL